MSVHQHAFADVKSTLLFLSFSNNLLGKIPVDSLNTLEELYHLGISYNRITHLEDGSFQKLKKLELLNLSNNGIETIRKNAFLRLLNLRSLDMSGNNLTGIATEFILPSAGNILLFNNDIRHILGPLVIKSGNRKIDLSFNNLSFLHPLAFLHMNETTNIVLRANVLTSEFTCGSVWEPLIHLRTLNLKNNSIAFIPALCFLALRSLVTLELNQNNISELDNNAFKGLQNVYKLDLNDNGIKAVCNESLYGLINLKRLLMNRNKINGIQLGSFTSTRKMETLLLGSNTLQTSDICHLVWQPLINLKLLNLHSNRISTIESGCFKHLVSLKYLLLQNNTLSNLENNSFVGLANLWDLNLSNNRLQVMMNGSLTGLDKLEHLFLENNKIQVLQAGSFHFLKHLTLIQLKGNLLITILENIFPSTLLDMGNIILDQNPFVCSCKLSWLGQHHPPLSAKPVCNWSGNINETVILKQFLAEQCSDWHLTTKLPANDLNTYNAYIKYNFILLTCQAVLALLTIVATVTVIYYILKRGRSSLLCKGESSHSEHTAIT